MNQPPYSSEEACKIRESYCYLIGQQFDSRISGSVIDKVIVVPFEESSRNTFWAFYYLTGDEKLVLKEVYSGLLFDVWLVGHSPHDPNEVLKVRIGTWLSQNVFGRAGFNIAEKIKNAIKNTDSQKVS